MRIIEKHILKHTLLPIIFCGYTLILLFIIGDVFDKLGEILQNKTPLMLVLKYYALLVPYAYSQTISWATFLATVYMFTTFTRTNELIAMKASGLSIRGIAKPIIFIGICLSMLTFVINDYYLPKTYRLAQEIKAKEIEHGVSEKKEEILHNITLLTESKQYFIKTMNVTNGTLDDIRVHFLDRHNAIIKRIVARSAVWKDERWIFDKISIYELGPHKKIIGEPQFHPTAEIADIKLTPDDLTLAAKSKFIRSSKEMKQTAHRLQYNGLEYRGELVSYYAALAAPWMNLVIIFIAIPFLAKSAVRKGMVGSIIMSILFIFSYHASNAIILALGKKGFITPLLSGWGAHILFLFVALLFIRRANH